MKKDVLSRIYFDDIPVKLLGDESRPPLDRIVRAGGKIPGRVDVVVLASPTDKTGHALPPGEIIDRTVEPAKPIYLRSVPKPEQEVPPQAAQPSVQPIFLRPEANPVDPARPKADADPVIAQLGVDPAQRAGARADVAALRRAEDQERAEAEAQERQEEDREQEDVLQDEQEDERQAQGDLESQD